MTCLFFAVYASGVLSVLVAGEKSLSCSAAGGICGSSLLQAHQRVGRTTIGTEPEYSRAAPHAAGWLGWGRWVAREDLWHMQHVGGENLFARHMPGECFEEAACRHNHGFKSENFESIESWSSYYSSSFGLGVSGGYQGFTGSIDASLGSQAGSSGQESKRVSFAAKTSQLKCYRLRRDNHCAYNKTNLQPAMIARLEALPKGEPYTEEKMKAWQASFIQRYGTHIAMTSSHGALVQSLISVNSRSEVSSACMDSSLCLSFGWVAPAVSNLTGANAKVSMCSKTSSCDNRTGSSLSERSTCVALGGDPALQSKICGVGVSQQTLEDWLVGGDLNAGSSAFRFSFTPLSEFLTNVDFEEYYSAAMTLEKAIEYSNCRIGENPAVQSWDGSRCKCVRHCQNGGTVDPSSCTCKCRGDLKHGWKGPNCEETYGSCQPGPGTGNQGAARKCPAHNRCSSWYRTSQCHDTELCCATNFGTKCCPFGSTCRCGSSACECRSAS